MTFTLYHPSLNKDNLIALITKAKRGLMPEAKGLLRDVLKGGYVDGAESRHLSDTDSPVGSYLNKQEYNTAVMAMARHFKLDRRTRKIFYACALYSFHEGSRTQGKREEEIISPVLEAIN